MLLKPVIVPETAKIGSESIKFADYNVLFYRLTHNILISFPSLMAINHQDPLWWDKLNFINAGEHRIESYAW